MTRKHQHTGKHSLLARRLSGDNHALTSFFDLGDLPPLDASILAADRLLRRRALSERHRVSYGDAKSGPAANIFLLPFIEKPLCQKQAAAGPAPRQPSARAAAGAVRKAALARNPCDPVRASASRIELVVTHDIAISAGNAPSPRCAPRLQSIARSRPALVRATDVICFPRPAMRPC